MYNRLIKISDCPTCKEVLVQIRRNEDGEDYVELTAWHESEEYGGLFQSAKIEFEKDNEILMQCYVHDFTERSAFEFANSMQF